MEIMTKIRQRTNSWRSVILMIFIICFFLTATVFGGEKVQSLYDVQGALELKPQEFEATGGLFGTRLFGGYSNVSLFPVPIANSVGTNQMGNAITVISFPGKRISFDRYFKDADASIEYGEIFFPVLTQDMIALGLPRAFLLFDFKKKIHRTLTITPDISENIEKAAVVDARKKLFMFEVARYSGKSPNPWDFSGSLVLLDLSGEKTRLLKELPIPRHFLWYVVGDKNFLYRNKTQQLLVYDMNLEPSLHPLADVIEKHKDKFDFVRIISHPTLPFAVLDWGKSGAIVANWGKDRDTFPQVLIRRVDQFSFSPDGKWVAFQQGGVMGDKKTYVMPVSEKYPYYLGSPILLLDKYYFDDDKSAWTTKPTGFVGSFCESIYRWDLENRDFPEKGKMSFHDYIVQEDLKKLAREKRQGLGK